MARCARVALLCLAAVLAAASPAAAGRMVFRVSARPLARTGSHKPLSPIQPGFIGTSMDYCAITQYTGASADRVLVNLVSALAPGQRPVIRIGGNGTDSTCPSGPPPVVVAPAAIAALAHAVDARLILGVNLAADDPGLVAPEVSALLNALHERPPYPLIDAFEIGNEPDLYPQYSPAIGAPDNAPYFFRYLSDFTRWAQLIRSAARDRAISIAGPSLGRLGLPWFTGGNTADFSRFIDSPARPSPITFHLYPLLSSIACPAPLCPTMPSLLADSSSRGLAAQVVPFIRRLGSGRLRVDEMNSVTGGGVAGISNTFASALWALDTVFQLARAGVTGVNVHTFPGARYALYSGPGAGGWRVFPEYYGLLTFARVAPPGSQLLSVHGTGAAGDAVKIWATRASDGTLRVVAINKDVVAHQVLLRGAGVPVKSSATVQLLAASPASPASAAGWCPALYATSGMCATGGVSLGGASFGPQEAAGGDYTASGRLGRPRPGTCARLLRCEPQRPAGPTVLRLPAGTATILTGPAVPAHRPPGHRLRRYPLGLRAEDG